VRALLTFFILGCAVAEAQVTTGTILGTVKDSTQAPVAGAAVTVTETGKGTALHFITDDSGAYQAPLLIPGTYSVTIEREGFKKAIQSNVTLEVDQKARVDFTLELGAVTETMNVTEAPPIVQADSSELGQVITGATVQELPLNGRNFAQLVWLVPDVTPGAPTEALSGQSALNPRGASNFNPLGQSSGANGWLVDGIDNNEYTFNTIIVMPAVEAVREFKVLTGSYSAEFGRGAGVVSIATRSGSDELLARCSSSCETARWMPSSISTRPTLPSRHIAATSSEAPGAVHLCFRSCTPVMARRFFSWTTPDGVKCKAIRM